MQWPCILVLLHFRLDMTRFSKCTSQAEASPKLHKVILKIDPSYSSMADYLSSLAFGKWISLTRYIGRNDVAKIGRMAIEYIESQ